MFLHEIHFLGRSFRGPPRFDPALQRPQLSVGEPVRKLPPQRRDDRFASSAGLVRNCSLISGTPRQSNPAVCANGALPSSHLGVAAPSSRPSRPSTLQSLGFRLSSTIWKASLSTGLSPSGKRSPGTPSESSQLTSDREKWRNRRPGIPIVADLGHPAREVSQRGAMRSSNFELAIGIPARRLV